MDRRLLHAAPRRRHDRRCHRIRCRAPDRRGHRPTTSPCSRPVPSTRPAAGPSGSRRHRTVDSWRSRSPGRWLNRMDRRPTRRISACGTWRPDRRSSRRSRCPPTLLGSLALSSDGRLLAVAGGEAGRTRIFDATSGERLARTRTDPPPGRCQVLQQHGRRGVHVRRPPDRDVAGRTDPDRRSAHRDRTAALRGSPGDRRGGGHPGARRVVVAHERRPWGDAVRPPGGYAGVDCPVSPRVRARHQRGRADRAGAVRTSPGGGSPPSTLPPAASPQPVSRG